MKKSSVRFVVFAFLLLITATGPAPRGRLTGRGGGCGGPPPRFERVTIPRFERVTIPKFERVKLFGRVEMPKFERVELVRDLTVRNDADGAAFSGKPGKPEVKGGPIPEGPLKSARPDVKGSLRDDLPPLKQVEQAAVVKEFPAHRKADLRKEIAMRQHYLLENTHLLHAFVHRTKELENTHLLHTFIHLTKETEERRRKMQREPAPATVARLLGRHLTPGERFLVTHMQRQGIPAVEIANIFLHLDSPRGENFVRVVGGWLQLWDLEIESIRPLTRATWKRASLRALAFSQDGTVLATAMSIHGRTKFFWLQPAPREPEAHCVLLWNLKGEKLEVGTVLDCQQEYDQAIADFTRVMKLDPRHARAYYERGKVYAKKQADPQVRADLDKAVKLDAKLANQGPNPE